jgi:hypothetical protein
MYAGGVIRRHREQKESESKRQLATATHSEPVAAPERGSGASSGTGRGGRPSGRSFGFLLDCWFNCYQFGDRFDSPRHAYDEVQSLARADRITEVHPPVRTRYPAARSYAAAIRTKSGKCLWYRHNEPPPSA